MGNFKWNPNAKEQSKKAKVATSRNMNKARLTGFILDVNVLTDLEKFKVQKIREHINLLLRDWDENSKNLGMEVKRYILRARESKEEEFKIWNTNMTRKEINFLTSHYTKQEKKDLIKITKL